MSKILVVDDDIDILSVMEILLSMKGFDVEVTSKGENTFPKIERWACHLQTDQNKPINKKHSCNNVLCSSGCRFYHYRIWC